MVVKIAALAGYNVPHFLIHMALHIQKTHGGGDLASILRIRYGVDIDAKTLEKLRKTIVAQQKSEMG